VWRRRSMEETADLIRPRSVVPAGAGRRGNATWPDAEFGLSFVTLLATLFIHCVPSAVHPVRAVGF
jgi:hypothetical protein